MINLMPYDAKKQTRAARTNTVLFQYIVILGLSLAFLSLVCVATYYFIYSNKPKTANGNNSSSIQSQASTVRNNLATAKNILDRQVSYSDVITGIAAALPTGTILDSISLTDASFGSTTNLKILSRSNTSEPKLKEGFSGSRLFSNYQLQSANANQGGPTDYPFVINISVIINKVTN